VQGCISVASGPRHRLRHYMLATSVYSNSLKTTRIVCRLHRAGASFANTFATMATKGKGNCDQNLAHWSPWRCAPVAQGRRVIDWSQILRRDRVRNFSRRQVGKRLSHTGLIGAASTWSLAVQVAPRNEVTCDDRVRFVHWVLTPQKAVAIGPKWRHQLVPARGRDSSYPAPR
jgi:hypothetical protein